MGEFRVSEGDVGGSSTQSRDAVPEGQQAGVDVAGLPEPASGCLGLDDILGSRQVNKG